jgi:hypothetical protein
VFFYKYAVPTALSNSFFAPLRLGVRISRPGSNCPRSQPHTSRSMSGFNLSHAAREDARSTIQGLATGLDVITFVVTLPAWFWN